MDTALPGKHTRELYNKLKRREASVLAQLRTGMTRLNGFLSRIGAAESDQSVCGHARETVEHFLRPTQHACGSRLAALSVTHRPPRRNRHTLLPFLATSMTFAGVASLPRLFVAVPSIPWHARAAPHECPALRRRATIPRGQAALILNCSSKDLLCLR